MVQANKMAFDFIRKFAHTKQRAWVIRQRCKTQMTQLTTLWAHNNKAITSLYGHICNQRESHSVSVSASIPPLVKSMTQIHIHKLDAILCWPAQSFPLSASHISTAKGWRKSAKLFKSLHAIPILINLSGNNCIKIRIHTGDLSVILQTVQL